MEYEEQTNWQRLAAVVRALNGELHWGLRDDEQQAYATNLLRCWRDDKATEAALRRLVQTYHTQWPAVRALQQASDPHHTTEWHAMGAYVQRVLWQRVNRSLPNLPDIVEEISQVVLLAIHQSLPTYCYRSKLTTWVHKITINKYLNYLRTPNVPPGESIDAASSPPPPLVSTSDDQPDNQVESQMLIELINTILQEHQQKHQQEHQNPRLLQAFLLKLDDLTLKHIGQRIGRSTTRTHELINQARVIIQADPRFQAWLAASNPDDEPDDEPATEPATEPDDETR